MNLSTKKSLKNFQNSKYAALMPYLREEKTQKFTTTVFTILALIFFGLFAINPTLSTIANLHKQLEDNQHVYDKLEEKINNLSALQKKYSEISNDLPIIKDAIPEKSEIPLLFAQIQSLAKEENLTLNGIQAQSVDLSNDLLLGKKYVFLPFSITLSGEYENIKNFTTKLTNIQRIINIENVSITKSNQGNNSSLELIIKANAYFKQ